MNKEAILKANDLKREPIEVPEWGGTLYLREMSGLELPVWQEACLKAKNPEEDLAENVGLMALVIALCICDESGALLFDASDADTLKALRGRNIRVLTRVSREAIKHSGLDGGTVDAVEKK